MKKQQTLTQYSIYQNTDDKHIARIMLLVLYIWLIVQVVVIVHWWGHPQYSDPQQYLLLANKCFHNNTWYPMPDHVYSPYIFAPGLINYLVLQLNIFGTTNTNSIFNMLMNVGIAVEIYYLGKKFFNERTARLAVIFWCVLYSNIIIIAVAGTEIPFVFLALTAFCLCLSKKGNYLIVAGLLFALADWIRPLILIFIPSLLIYMVWQKYKVKHYLLVLVPMFSLILLIGMVTKNRFGYFVFQSTTSGVNLIMTAYDNAYGGVASSMIKDSTTTGYIKFENKYTFLQRDSIWKSRAIVWIKKHPVKFATLYIKKLGGLYIEDSWADRPLLGDDAMIDAYNAGKITKAKFISLNINRGAKSLLYYLVLIAFFYSLIVNRRSLISEKGIILLILIIGTLLTAVFAVSPRYHYPFAFVLVLFAAYGVDTWKTNNNKIIRQNV